MRIRKRKWAEPELEKCNFFIKNPIEYKNKWNQQFSKSQPLYLELGCGKGTFIAECIKQHPEINYMAIDIKSDMLGLTKRNIEEMNTNPQNICLIAYDIERMADIFGEEDKIDRIYINFCNPWPKARHRKRRLTHPKQLEVYKKLLKPEACIYFKTDDDSLFEESISYFEKMGFQIIKESRDLHKEDEIENIITEHEKMFSKQGIKIKFLIARKEEEKNETKLSSVGAESL